MKVLLATEKPFAAAAVQGIRKAIEEGGHTLAILENIQTAPNCLRLSKMPMRSSCAATLSMVRLWMSHRS